MLFLELTKKLLVLNSKYLHSISSKRIECSYCPFLCNKLITLPYIIFKLHGAKLKLAGRL